MNSIKTKKGVKKDGGEINVKYQKKLTNYFSANSLSTTFQVTPQPEQSKQNPLKQELQIKQDQLQKMRTQKQIYQHRYSKLYFQNRNYRTKSKQIISKIMMEQGERIRLKRRRIDYRLGYFSQGVKQFIDGQDWIKLKNIFKQKSQLYEKLKQELRKCRNNQEMNRIKFSMMYLKKQIVNTQNELKAKQKQVNIYKQRLKLAYKQLHCNYAKQNWIIIKDTHQRQRYIPIELLGQGGFGEVYKCFDLEENQFVAIKINQVKICLPATQNHIFKHVQREARAHSQLKHPNIAQIKQILQLKQPKMVFVMQYCQGPQLSLYIKQKKCIEEKDAKKIIHQVFSALYYLCQREQKVIHYDLKPSNIMFHRGVIKILDFGLCKLMDSQDSRMELTSQGLGTYWYLPPETFKLQHTTITAKVDIWSAGVIFFQMLYGRRPFANGVTQKIIQEEDLITKQSEKLIFPEGTPNGHRVSVSAQEFIRECLTLNPEKRLSASQAYFHKYFQE